MPFNVMDYLRPRKQAKAMAIHHIAEKLHRGEEVDPDTILQSLEQSGATEEQLQGEIDRLDRVVRLRREMAAAGPAQKRLDAINAEVSKVADKLEAAALEVQRIREKYAAESTQLLATIQTAEDATAKLVTPANMTPQQQQEWQALKDAMAGANEAHSIALEDLSHAKERMEECDIEHPKAQAQLKDNRTNQHIVENAKRWDNAKAARTTQLQEAHAALRHAAGAVADANAAEKQFRANIVAGDAK